MKAESEMSPYEIQLRNDIRRRKQCQIHDIRLKIELLKVELADLEAQDLTLIEEPKEDES